MSTYTVSSTYDGTSIPVQANNAIAALNLWVACSSNLRQEYDDQLFEDLCSFVSVDGAPVQLVYLQYEVENVTKVLDYPIDLVDTMLF